MIFFPVWLKSGKQQMSVIYFKSISIKSWESKHIFKLFLINYTFEHMLKFIIMSIFYTSSSFVCICTNLLDSDHCAPPPTSFNLTWCHNSCTCILLWLLCVHCKIWRKFLALYLFNCKVLLNQPQHKLGQLCTTRCSRLARHAHKH